MNEIEVWNADKTKEAYESFEYGNTSRVQMLDNKKIYKLLPTSAEVTLLKKLEEPAMKWRLWLCVLVAVALLLLVLSISLKKQALLVAAVAVLVLLLISIAMAPLVHIIRQETKFKHTEDKGTLQQFMKTIHGLGEELDINVENPVDKQ